jgi:hypothetical protein
MMQTLKELRCEGVNFNALRLVLCKDILAHLRLHTFCEMGKSFGSIFFVILTFALLHLFTRIIWFFFEG